MKARQFLTEHHGWRMAGCAVLLSLSLPVLAGSPEERLPGVVDRPAKELEPAETRREGVSAPIPAAPKGDQVANPNQVLMQNLSSINFKGNSVIDEPTLQEVVAPFVGSSLTAGGLAELKYAITRLYYDQGYVLVKVTTPPQDVSSGSLDVVIYEAQIGAIDIPDSELISPILLGKVTKRVESGEVFREGPVESMVNDVNDLGGVKASLNLRPGTQVGTTDMALVVEPTDDDVQRFTIDNYGSELTGEYVGMAQLEKSNLLGWGETFRFNGRKSDGDLWSVLFGATIPTGFYNVKMDVDYVHSENEIGDRLSSLNASGETDFFGIGFSSAIINQRSRKLTINAGFQARSIESFLFDVTESKDELRQFYVEGNYLWNWPNTVGYASMRLTKGVDFFGASSDDSTTTSRLGGDPQGTKINPLLYIGHQVSDKGLIKALFVGQWSNNKLLAGDLYVLGGYGSIRGFNPGESLGESAIQMNLEYQHRIYQQQPWAVFVGPFLDVGKVFPEFKNAVVDDTLASAGLGLEVSTSPSLWNYGDTSLRFDWAHTLGDYDSPQVEDNTFYFRLTQTF